MEPDEHPIFPEKSDAQLVEEVWAMMESTLTGKQRNHFIPKEVIEGCPPNTTLYEFAKTRETDRRNLRHALLLYAYSAKTGKRVDSCIKDVASIMHQMGFTTRGLKFLEVMQPHYRGELKPYRNLIRTLENQLDPSIKHQVTGLALELNARIMKPAQKEIEELFESCKRVKKVQLFNHMGFNSTTPSQLGNWLVLRFKTYSAAKKTLQSFNYPEWFGLRRYWLKGSQVICEARLPRQQQIEWEDFDRETVVDEEKIMERIHKEIDQSYYLNEVQLMNFYNQFAVEELNSLVVMKQKATRVPDN